MSTTQARSAFWRGLRDAAPFVLVVAPFGLLFGVVGTEAGLRVSETMAMSVLIIAGAAQFTALALIEDGAPTLIVILTALAVNLRMALYSASLAPHLGQAPIWQRALVAYFMVDQTYAASVAEYERRPMNRAAKLAFFAGTVIIIAPFWYVMTYVGAVAGEAIPPEYALDFAVPITFLAIVAPNMRSLPHLAAAIMSVCLALALVWVPYSMGLMIAALCAMFTGAAVERLMEQRNAD